MLKKILTTCLLCSGMLFSAAQTNSSSASDAEMTYQRNSISVVPITGMSNYDAIVVGWAKNQDFDGKFDYNAIKTPHIGKVSPTAMDSIGRVLCLQGVPKKVADYWLQYDGKTFHTNVMERRSAYNATDADVLRDRAAQVETIKYNGRELMKNSFVLVAGPTAVTSKRDDKGKITYYASSTGFVYHVAFNDEVLETIWSNWLDDEATDENRKNYDNLVIGLESNAAISGVEGSGETPQEAIHASLNELYEKLEKKVAKWNVVTTVYQLHPIGAKIGTKERLRNSDRYAVFRVVEDQAGDLHYKRVGYVRATKIADNNGMADGKSPCSYFYQISGRRNAKEGMFLQQSKDAHMSVSLSGNFVNAYATVNADIDYLIHTSQKLGTMQYGGISIGGYFGDNEFGKSAVWIPVGLHYGVGIHFTRWCEFQPNIGFGFDYYMDTDSDSDSDSDESFMDKTTLFAHGGVKLGFQICYPVQIFVRADYSAKFMEGDYYVPSSKERFGFGLGAGLRINF